MADISLGPNLTASETAALRGLDSDVGKGVTLLKKALNSEKELIQTLLPTPGQQGLDIQA